MADSPDVRVLTVACAGLLAAFPLEACGDDGHGNDLARAPREKTLSAPYLVVSRGGGREILHSPTLTVIRRRGRVVVWASPAEELSLRRGRRCYDRTTDFNHDDLRQLREAAWPAQSLDDLQVEARGRGQVLTGRERHMDFADTEHELFVDEHGRMSMARQRSARFGVIPPGRWKTVRYRYPSAAQFARLTGRTPRPRCS